MSRRRGHGEGNVSYRQHDCRWQAYVSLTAYGKPGGRKYVYAATEAEVIEKKKSLEAALAAGLPIPDERITVGAWLRRWLELHQEGRSQNTVDNYMWAVERHIVPAVGRIRLRRLTPADVATLLQRKANEGLGKSSRMRIRSVLVMALRQAEIEGLVHRNVAAVIRAPATAKTEGRSLTVEEARRLLDQAEGDRLGAAVAVMLTMGLRPGETLGLTWENVNLDDGVIHIRHSLVREKTGLALGKTKTPKSRRSVAVPPLTLAALRSHRRTQTQQRLKTGPRWSDHDLVFASEVGTPIDPSNLRRAVSQLTEASGLGHWSPNELRHSAVSLMSAAGVPVEEIADVVGHDGSRMTTGVYRHVLTPVISSGADPMQQLLTD